MVFLGGLFVSFLGWVSLWVVFGRGQEFRSFPLAFVLNRRSAEVPPVVVHGIDLHYEVKTI